ncbi:uncharacterized protein LOC115748487 [Rhodamnia argentea]|uniref:Uncharacterized protein LOC115748487 n=1 Tax=Rhodamnia argentea TaxID=178133 RepID=A0A8B8Q190_9MYRT|nr:uncharacterized protein LOC115748487 [Rhodamnia argentea]XP_048136100.1 uncharacterized protein LOC115748487 [Rhodamnia argentea]
MTSVGDGNGNGGEPSAPIPNANSIPTGTLPSDREFSRSPSPESGDMMEGETLDELYVESTMQFDDTAPLDGAFETQILDTGGETQLVDFGGETQVIECEDGIGNVETQLLLDACDTQIAFDSHSEDTGGTEVLGSDDEISDGGLHGKGGYSRDEKKMSCSSLSKDSETREQSTALTDEPCSSGAVRRGFTSIRVASLRASGLAARSMYLNGASSLSCSLLSTRQSSEEQASDDNGASFRGAYIKSGEEFDQECDAQTSLEISKMEHGKKCKIGSGAVRRLFAEDVVDNMPDETSDLKEVPLGNDQLAGLSYVESQEPGDLSQANALDFVDRFLKDNVEQLHEELDFGKTVGRKPLSITSAKGPQNLAKSASRITVRAEVFDWDDGREDEGGGDIFCRRKEDFFDGGSSKCRSITLPRKHRNRKQDGNGDKEEPSSAPCTTTGVLHSDSEAILRMGGKCQMMAKEAEMNHKRDLTSQLDEQSKIDSRDDLEAITGDACVPDMPSVGFDTQLAAEAMEELCQGEALPREDNCDISISTRKLRSTNRDYNEQIKKSAITLQKHSKDKETCHRPGDKTRKLEMTGLTANRNKKSNKLPSKNLQPKNRESLRRRQAGEFGKQGVTRTSNVGTFASKQQLLGEVGLFTPIASRTRSSSAVNHVQRTESLLCNHKKATDGAENVGVCKRKRSNRERRSSKKSEDDSMVKAKGNSLEQFLAVESSKRSVRQKRIKTDATSKGDLEVQLPTRNPEAGPENGTSESTSFKLNRELLAERSNMTDAIRQSETKGDVGATSSTQNMEANAMLDHTPREKCNVNSARTTPLSCSTPFNDASPVCVGNGYMNPSCKKNLSRSYLRNEIKSLNASGPEPSSAYKDMRKRRDMSDICVLYSHHLDDDIVKQQKKILARLGASAVSSIAEATHFITDEFVRTRNMLEAIASGKPVVTHLWLESCGQANCFLDERNYILRDAKKEKQFGFSMPVSLARACQHPLLLGRRVLITPNAKPGKDIISSLVKAVGGQPVERIGRSAVKDDKVLDDLLILSCEDDYDMCLPFLEKGAAVYSSELLLNGIVTQKLEYERHRLFADHVKRTRSTIWLKKDGSNFVPVTKHK